MRILLALIFISQIFLTGCGSLAYKEVESKWANPADGSKFIEVDHMRVHYRDEGDSSKPVLLLVHGISDSLHTWNHWANELKNEYRVVRIDVPGFGLTSNVTQTKFTPDFYNAFLDKLTAELRIDKVIMVGNSLGGYISWNYAIHAPKRVNALVLLDPAAYPLTPPWIVRIASSPFRFVAETYSPRWMTALIAKDVFADSDKVSDEIIDRYHTMLTLDGARERYMNVFASINEFSDKQPEGIEKIEAPVLLLWGEKDKWIPTKQIDLWKRDVKNVKAIIYPGAGHVLQEEAPIKSLKDARPFIKRYAR